MADDRCPLVKPIPKKLTVFKSIAPELESFVTNLLRIFVACQSVHSADHSDLSIQSVQDSTQRPTGSGIFFMSKDPGTGVLFTEPILPEQHSLTEGLSWEGFSTMPLETFEIDETFDQVLL